MTYIPNLSGQRINQYKLRDALGVGSMSVVYRAYHHDHKRDVAVKTLLPDLTNQERFISRFTQGMQTISRLDHPSLVPILDYGHWNNIGYLVMPLLSRGTLAQQIRQRRENGQCYFSLSDTVNLLKPIASALDYSHSLRLIHRALKPGNILFDDHDRPFLADCGLAVLLDTVTPNLNKLDLTTGTYAYMAPEMWSGKRPTPAADQYAVGLLVYLLLTGRPAFGTTPGALHVLMNKHLHEMPIPAHRIRSEVPEVVTEIIERAIAKNPEARFPSITAFIEQLDAAAHGDLRKNSFSFTHLRGLKKASHGLQLASGEVTVIHPREWSNAPTVVNVRRPRITRTSLSTPRNNAPKIFVSYRRTDSTDITGRICDRLEARFGKQMIFMDVESIPLGTNFKKYLENVISQCAVELVVIGEQWLNIADETGERRLDNPDDFVRIEIETALNADIPVLPLLVRDAILPDKESLPPCMAELSDFEAMHVRCDPDFHGDIDLLVSAIEVLLKQAALDDTQ